jgi:soluble lytic murein transglycosylase-like protein
MNSMVIVMLVLSGLFPQIIERAFNSVQQRDWSSAAAALDEAARDDSAAYAANSLAYLRGRVAENQSDWTRSLKEFQSIGSDNPLRPLAAWHAAAAALRLRDNVAAEALYNELPAGFPADLKMQLAELAPSDLALRIYRSMSTREAKFERARIQGDKGALWSLLHERKDDDVALQCAHLLVNAATNPRERIEVAGAFIAHRQFDYALPLYQTAAQDTDTAAESRYQIARIQFLREDYRSSIETYSGVVKDFAGTEWEKDSRYQMASCYWRLGDFESAEDAYLKYIAKYGLREDGAIRNLVDVYRVKGENQKALQWIEKGLAQRLPLSSRQVLLFTKAKVLYTQKRYTAASQLFHQLGGSTIRPSPGGTTREEARYFEALSLSKAGRTTAAKAIFRTLASSPFTYYGIRSAEKLDKAAGSTESPGVCTSSPDGVLASARNDLLEKRRALMGPSDAMPKDAVSELMFLQLWDEASRWKESGTVRSDFKTAAELAYVAGRYHRAITYGDHLPPSNPDTLSLTHPFGFHQLICTESSKYHFDPLWLHAIIWQESKYNPLARSGASARGLMQFIPETANAVGAEIGISEFSLDRLYDPTVNIPMGAHYWASLLDEFKDPVLALAAYNGGPDNVRRWKSKWPSGDDDLFVADIGFAETKKYVMAVYGARATYAALGLKDR